MNTLKIAPLYRRSVGFDQLSQLFDDTRRVDQIGSGYPPYDITATGENNYAISLAVAGFEEKDIAIELEKNVLTVKGKKNASGDEVTYLHRGIANRSFERKFNLAEDIEVRAANLNNGLLSISLERFIPEEQKLKTIPIGKEKLEHLSS